MSAQLDEVVERIADIVRRVGKREEVEDAVAENIDFANVANGLLNEAGPVRDAAIKAVTKMLENLEIESGGDIEAEILEGVDFKLITAELLKDPEVTTVLKGLVKGVIEETDSDTLSETVEEAFGFSDSDRLMKMFDKDGEAELREAVAKRIREIIEARDFDDLDTDTQEEITKSVFSKERIDACLPELGEEARTALAGFALSVIRGADPDDTDDALTGLVLASHPLKLSVQRAMESLNRTDQLDRLVEEVVISMFAEKGSQLRSRIEASATEKLTEVVQRTTESVVDRLRASIR